LLNRGEPVRLGGRALDLLLALIRQPGQTLSQRELVAQVWPTTIVEDSSLRVHVAALRRALRDGEDGNCYIGNVPGRGYSFLAEVQPQDGDGAPIYTSPEAAYVGLPGGATRLIRMGEYVRLSSMVGRDKDLDFLAARLRVGRLTNIVGCGGVGKSTLAFATAAHVRQVFSSGVFHCDFGMLGELGGLGDEIAAMLQSLPERDEHDAATARKVLLIFDNCEHLIGAASALVERLLRATPQLTILTTSREPLQAEGEYIYRLRPLAAPLAEHSPVLNCQEYPALQLLFDRTGNAFPDFSLDAECLQLAAGICRRLDGLPLALEFAAASIGTLGMRDISDQLNRQQLLLRSAQRSRPARHDCLRACYDWSYRLLTPMQQGLFRSLGTIAGHFTLESACSAASEVDMTPAQLTTTLMELVARSMVVADFHADGTRYRLLHTARAYAIEQLMQPPSPLPMGELPLHQNSRSLTR
jgi:predicted ATPase/DNA-binding winged helix-turn-helix (wHTH) protein